MGENHEALSLPRFPLSAALIERSEVRLSSRKAACGSVAPQSSAGNPGSVYTNCETDALGAGRSESNIQTVEFLYELFSENTNTCYKVLIS